MFENIMARKVDKQNFTLCIQTFFVSAVYNNVCVIIIISCRLVRTYKVNVAMWDSNAKIMYKMICCSQPKQSLFSFETIWFSFYCCWSIASSLLLIGRWLVIILWWSLASTLAVFTASNHRDVICSRIQELETRPSLSLSKSNLLNSQTLVMLYILYMTGLKGTLIFYWGNTYRVGSKNFKKCYN